MNRAGPDLARAAAPAHLVDDALADCIEFLLRRLGERTSSQAAAEFAGADSEPTTAVLPLADGAPIKQAERQAGPKAKDRVHPPTTPAAGGVG